MSEDSYQELINLIRDRAARRLALVVSVDEVHIELKEAANKVYVLELGLSDAAGGRAGGFGQRTVSRIRCFVLGNGVCSKVGDASGSALEGFEPPYHATLTPVTMEEGSEVMVAGVIDPALVAEYDSILRW